MRRAFPLAAVLVAALLAGTLTAYQPTAAEAAPPSAGPTLPAGRQPTPAAPAVAPTPLPKPDTWVAGETSVSRLSPEEQRRLLGVPAWVEEWEREQAAREAPKAGALYTYPAAVDWRDVGGQDFTTPIRNQGNCGSCVAFGTIGAIESRLEIAASNAHLEPDLSEGQLFFCNGGGRTCSTGWWPENAMYYAYNTGVVDELCYPYVDQQEPCSVCSGWQSRVTKITGWTPTSNVADMKQALADHGPFEVTMAVYQDFFSYQGGVYAHTSGDWAGNHAIAIVGYDDSGGYWICKNSWGTGWGQNGWFRIAYGECSIDDYAYIPYVAPPPADCYWLSPAIGSGRGSISGSPAPNCTGTGSYSAGTNLQLTGNPAAGFAFDRWEGEVSGSANPVSVTMSASKRAVAYFAVSCADGDAANTCAQATAVSLPVDLLEYICPSGDVDWYRFGLVSGETAYVSLSSLPADYDLYLFRPDGSEAAYSWNASTNDEALAFVADADGEWRVAVAGWNGAYDPTDPYRLRIDTSRLCPGGDGCPVTYLPLALKR